MAFWRRLASQLTLGLFVVSILSGLMPVFVYHPSAAYESVQKLTFLLPYGLFFRQLHYVSSELFLVLLLIHIGLELGRRNTMIGRSSWLYAVLGTLAVILLMFSGFVLKGDQSGSAAAQVALHLMEETPWVDRLIPLLQDNELFYSKFFVWHILFLPLLLVLTIWKHIGYIGAKREFWIVGLGLSALGLVLTSMPPDIPPGESVTHLKGPWFFQGAENLLQLGLSAWQVNAIVAIPFGLLILYPFVKQHRLIVAGVVLWLVGYTFVSVWI